MFQEYFSVSKNKTEIDDNSDDRYPYKIEI